MEFALSAVAEEYGRRLADFMDVHVRAAERVYREQRAALVVAGQPNTLPAVVEELKSQARSRGLWNLFLPAVSGLSNLDYAHLAEMSGWSPDLAPEAMNCSAPDTGNMEVLHLFGTAEQKQRWLTPLLDGRIRSAFAMTEPDVASSDATNICTRIDRAGPDYVINGRKWWITGAADPRCEVLIVMGKTDPGAPTHSQQSMILIPRSTPGVTVLRTLPVFGYLDQHGHCEITFDDVHVPATNLIGAVGGGFAIAQARLGPGRIHHCMRLIGMAEHALQMMCHRAATRVAFGRTLAEEGVIQHQIAESRLAIDQARLLTLKTAWLIDTVGPRGARTEIAAIKVIAPRIATQVIDRAIQIHGGLGISDDTPLAAMYTNARILRIADGPDEVHLRTIAHHELNRHQSVSSAGGFRP